LGIALAAAITAAAALAAAAPASSGYDEGLAAYQKNDYARSLKLLRPLAERGDARAQYLVGRQYQFGQAVKADRAAAFYWYKRAEAKGHQEAKLFRLLLEKRWKITAAEKGRAERKIAVESAPKPKPPVARVESRPTPRPERSTAEAPKPRAKPIARAAERAKSPPAKPAVETARARLQEPAKPELAKTRSEPAAAKTPGKSAIAAVRNTVPEETASTPPAVRRDASAFARVTPRPPARSDDDDEDGNDGTAPRRYETPPPETRTAVAAVPNAPPPGDDHASDYAPYYQPGAPGYAPPPPNYPPPASYNPPAPYYAPGPAPYYAPAAPPSWRASIYFGPRPYYRQPWGYRAYRPYAAFAHPGWRGRGWRGRR
jgi:hypothetical protein